jgi:protein-disulfide isomerase
MASRTKQKEEARARRLAEERARAEQAQRQRRMRLVGGVVLIAIVIVGVAIAISSGGGSSSSSASLGTPAAKQSAAAVTSELSGIPQSGNRLGSASAKVTVTEWGDLECPICRDFADAGGKQLIAKDVKSGKVQLVYRSLETATGSAPDAATIFPVQQAAALAAGQQGHAWDYILTFYKLQGQESSGYVNTAFLNGIAKLVPGLNFAQWSSARNSPNVTSQVSADAAAAASKGFNSTPTLVVQGPKGQAQPLVGNVDYSAIESAIKSVS